MTQRSAVLVGLRQNLVVQKTEIPQVKASDILIKIHAAAVNPVDYKIPRTGRIFTTYPRVLGGDVAGTIEAVGTDIKLFKAGDRVLSFLPAFIQKEPNTTYGGFQQYTLSCEDTTAKIPDHIDFDAASTIGLALSTAADGFYNLLSMNFPSASAKKETDAEPILIWGGAGSVGQYAIQLAKHAGYRVITTASNKNRSFVQDLGADVVLDYNDQNVVQKILDAAQGRLTRVMDTISAPSSLKAVVACLPRGGSIAYTGMLPDDLEHSDSIEMTRIFAGNLYGSHTELGRQTFQWVQEALATGDLRPNPVELRSGGLDNVQDTLDFYASNGISGKKFVIRP